MALKPCPYCGEDIEEDTTVCPHCRIFEPFESSQPAGPVDTLSEPAEEGDPQGGEARRGWFKDALKELGCQYAAFCGFPLIAIAIVAVVTVIIAMCNDGKPEEFDCRELHDSVMDLTMDWEDPDTGQPLDDFRILGVTPDPDADTTAEHGAFCQAVALTTDGKRSIWYELEDDGTVVIFIEPLP